MKKLKKIKNAKKIKDKNFCQDFYISNKTQHKIVKRKKIWQYFCKVKQALNLSHNQRFPFAITFLSEPEIQQINKKFRQKDKATNILTFPYESQDLFAEFFLCPSIIQQEAQQQNKSIKNHYAHLLIHGFLHAFGYDHVEENQAKIMENLEINILQSLNISNPYE